MVMALIICMGITIAIAIAWARGIDRAMKDYPDYRGDDLFGYFDYLDKQKKKKENE
jgi:hypothetical protein